MKTRRRSITPETPEKSTYIDHLISIIAYCEANGEVALDEKSQKILALIELKFPTFIKKFNRHFKKTDEDREIVLNLQKIMYVAACLEQSDERQTAEYMKFAVTLYQLYGSTKISLEYLRRHVQPHAKLPVHDACLFQLPERKPFIELYKLSKTFEYDLEYWQKMVMRYGVKAARLMPLADRIDDIRRECLTGKNQNNLIGMSEIQRLHYYASKISYKNAEKDPELAALCMKFNKPEEIFEKCLSIVKSQLKKIDLLPEVSFDGAEIDKKFAGFRMEKLAADDLRGFFLGEYTGCCQHVGGAAETCAIDGMISPTAGFYVIYNQHNEIAVQLFAYISNDNKIVFDSWEPKAPEYNTMFEPFLEKAADIIIDTGFNGARVGVGGRTPLNSKFQRTAKPSQATNNVYPYDSRVQNVIKDREIPRSDIEIAFKEYLHNHGLDYKEFSHLITYPEQFNDNIIQVMRETSSDVFYLLYKFFYEHTIGPVAAPTNMKLSDMDTTPLYFMVAKNNDRSLDKPIQHLLVNLMAEGHLGTGSMTDVIQLLSNMTKPSDAAAIPRLLALSNIFNPEQPINELAVQFIDAMMREHSRLAPDISFEEYFGSETIDIHKAICTLAINATSMLNGADYYNYDDHEYTRHIKAFITDDLIPYLTLFADMGRILKGAVNTNDADLIYAIYNSLKSHHINYENTAIAHTYYVSVIPGFREVPLTMIALHEKKHEAAAALLNTFFTQEDLIRHTDTFLRNDYYQFRDNNYSLVEVFADNGDHGGITGMRKHFINEKDWLSLLLRSKSTKTLKAENCATALHISLAKQHTDKHAYDCALAIIASFENIDNLHAFLMNEDELKRKPLNLITSETIQRSPEGINTIAAAIRKAYSSKPDLLKELTDSITDKAFANLINRPAPKAWPQTANLSLFAADQKVKHRESRINFGLLRRK